MRKGTLHAAQNLKKKMRTARIAGALGLTSLLWLGAEQSLGSGEAVRSPSVYLYQRVLDSRGRETKDLYTGQNYTNEVRVSIPELLPPRESIAGMRCVLRTSQNVRVVREQAIQERPSYGSNDVFSGKRISTNNVVRVGTGESIRLLDIPVDAAGVVAGNMIVARYGFTINEPTTYAITSFIVEKALVRHPDGRETTPASNDLQAVALHAAYPHPVMITSRIEGNDPEYPGVRGVAFYFSVRNQRVFLENSFDLRTWNVLFSNRQTCPSFTLRVLDTPNDSMQFLRIRPGNELGQ